MLIICYAVRCNDQPHNDWITDLQERGAANSKQAVESYRRSKAASYWRVGGGRRELQEGGWAGLLVQYNRE